jgi:plasmid stability protein
VDVLVDIEDDDLPRLLLLAKMHGRSLKQELRDILIRAARAHQRLGRKRKKR